MTEFKNFVFVKQVPEEPQVSIKFKYTLNLNKQRLFNFNRDKTEPIKNFFKRAEQNVLIAIAKQSPKNQQQDLKNHNSLLIRLSDGVKEVDTSLNHIDSWKLGKILTIGIQSFDVIINGPSVINLKLPKTLFSYFTIYPHLELEFANFNQSQFLWYRQTLAKTSSEINKNDSNSKKDDADADSWELVFESFYYVPSNEDIGRRLKFKCIPVNCETQGYEREEVSKEVVKVSPGILPCEERHGFTQNFTKSGNIRVVSYNILADTYADSNVARNVLFNYCPSFALKFDYRKNLLIKEILGYNADIICLQEVDEKFFKRDLSLILENLRQMKGFYSEKTGNVKEGVACFFRKVKFTCLEARTESLTQLLLYNSLFKLYLRLVSSNLKLMKNLKERNTVVQFLLLKDIQNPNKALLVVNTHLYFHFNADHIRIFHASMIVIFIQHLLEIYQNQYPEIKISPLICGDFNSVPENGVYQLMTQGSVNENLHDWRNNPDEIIEQMSVSHSLSLASACGTPEYTNYCAGFKGCLDYIFYDKKNLKVNEVIPLPSHKYVTLHKALPSVIFPSDHLALVSVLSWI